MSGDQATTPGYERTRQELANKRRDQFRAGVLAVIGIAFVLACLFPTGGHDREISRRTTCKNNLKQIWLALEIYESVYHAFPPAHTVDANGKPLHRWRTLILPYLDEQQLYQKINLSKPWDDLVNEEAFGSRLDIFSCPSAGGPPNFTTYFAFVTPGSCFQSSEPRRLAEVTGSHSRILMLLEATPDRAVPWMSPADADDEFLMGFGPKSKLSHKGGTHACMVDGTIELLDARMSGADRRALISIADDDVRSVSERHRNDTGKDQRFPDHLFKQ